MTLTKLAAALLLGAPLAALPALAAPSDLVLLHGHLYTAAPAAPWAEAIAVSGARIDAVGSDAAVLRHRGPRTRVVDLHGQTVIPGLFDSHLHLLFGAMELHGLSLSEPARSITPDQPDELVARLRAYAAAHPADPVIFGRADFSASPPFAPGHELLDRAVADRPVVIHGTFEHSLWVNQRALDLAGITDEPVADASEERYVLRDASGHPGGVLIEAAMELVERAVQKAVPEEAQRQMLRDALRELNSRGITSAVDATGDLAELRRLAALRERGELTVRVRGAFGAVAVQHHLSEAFLADLDESRRQYHDEWLAANLVKFFADGSTGRLPPLVYEPAQYRALVVELDRRGYQLMTHAERADSVHMVLDAYAQAVQANGERDRRLRIEHAYVVEAPDLRRFAQQRVIASMQPVFCCSETGENFDPRVTEPSDQWKTLEDSGALIALGTDWPCSWPNDPFVNIGEAVTRGIWASADTAGVVDQPFDGAAQGGARPTGTSYTPQQRLSVRQAVDAYTRNAAYAAFRDQEVGTLEAGKLADFVVLSQDIFAVAPERVADTRVRETWVGGRRVYRQAP